MEIQRPLLNEAIVVWELHFNVLREKFKFFYSMLSEQEKFQANKFISCEAHEAFVITRGALRHILSGYLDFKPHDIYFVYNPYGKPGLKNNLCQFNVSHTKGMALIAIGVDDPLGIDIELKANNLNFIELGNDCFTKEEIEELNNYFGDNQTEIFFNLWTRKEAFIKAIGLGLSFDLKNFCVTGFTHEKPRLLYILDSHYKVEDWQLVHLNLNSPYVGALACSKHVKKIIRKTLWINQPVGNDS